MQNGMRILSLEANDIVKDMSANPEAGYIIPKNKDGKTSLSKFTNTLDRSLDRDKLEEVYKSKLRRNSMTFDVEGKDCTLAVINVEFNYNVDEFNIDFNTYVRYGYSYNADMLKDGAYVDENGKLIAIQTGVDVNDPLPPEVLGNSFKYENGKYKVGTKHTIMDTKKLREYLYINGFDVFNGKETIHYVRYKRSAGSARDGRCLFVDARLYDSMARWDRCGLPGVKEGDEIDLASWEAYIALTMSSIIDTIEIRPENILLVDDYNSIFTDKVAAVTLNQVTKKLEASIEEEKEICNCIWDGESLLDESMFGEKYKEKGMLLLRNRFFKSCAFNTNIQKWFEDNSITDVGQLNGFTQAKDIRDIKLIITPSSLKYLKFGAGTTE
ncbi:MAG: hypothetical protein J5879_10100, partial [Clostridia bacterium]|nr:hypothetical protein [Clostridia bacterium]